MIDSDNNLLSDPKLTLGYSGSQESIMSLRKASVPTESILSCKMLTFKYDLNDKNLSKPFRNLKNI